MSIIPGLPEHHGERQPAPAVIEQPGRLQREHDVQQARLLADRNSGALLLEKLRYKGYVKRGTLGTWMQTVGNSVRTNTGAWALIAWIVIALYYMSRVR